MIAGVVLACSHEGGEVGIFAFGRWRHTIIGIRLVGLEGGGAGLVIVFLKVVHSGGSRPRTLESSFDVAHGVARSLLL